MAKLQFVTFPARAASLRLNFRARCAANVLLLVVETATATKKQHRTAVWSKKSSAQSLRIKETTGVVDVCDCADRRRRCPFDDEMKVKNFGVRISSNGKRSFSQAAFLRRPSNAD